jgi:hypothetical protein
MSWHWTKAGGPATGEHLHLLDERGRNRCTIWPNGTWHTWDTRGVGGENDTARSVSEAMEQATTAVIRQGWASLATRRPRKPKPEDTTP